MKPFNAILIAIFVVLTIAAVGIVATFTGRDSANVGTVSIWGPLPENTVKPQIEAVRLSRNDFANVSYTAVPATGFIPALVEAIAASKGPDLVIFPVSYLVHDGDKLQTIPYAAMSRRDFQDSFIQAGEILLGDSGFKGIPYLVDPLVLYWNRTLFAAAGVASPPKYWDEVLTMAQGLSKADQNGSLTQSAVALGSWDNVAHAKQIILSLLHELGNKVVAPQGTGFISVLDDSASGSVSSAESAFRFYSGFADPTGPSYSWNRAEPLSRNAFLAGKLAMYIGSASELAGIRAANPNLDFDVAALPQARGAGAGSAADLYALAIPRGSGNGRGALIVAEALSAAPAQEIITGKSGTPSVRKDLLTTSAADPFSDIWKNAALNAFAFLDPDPAATDTIFKTAIESILSGKLKVSAAVGVAQNQLQALLKVR